MIDQEVLKILLWVVLGFIGGYSYAWGGSDHVKYRLQKKELEEIESK